MRRQAEVLVSQSSPDYEAARKALQDLIAQNNDASESLRLFLHDCLDQLEARSMTDLSATLPDYPGYAGRHQDEGKAGKND